MDLSILLIIPAGWLVGPGFLDGRWGLGKEVKARSGDENADADPNRNG